MTRVDGSLLIVIAVLAGTLVVLLNREMVHARAERVRRENENDFAA